MKDQESKLSLRAQAAIKRGEGLVRRGGRPGHRVGLVAQGRPSEKVFRLE